MFFRFFFLKGSCSTELVLLAAGRWRKLLSNRFLTETEYMHNVLTKML